VGAITVYSISFLPFLHFVKLNIAVSLHKGTSGTQSGRLYLLSVFSL
jgi:hypothetical protein